MQGDRLHGVCLIFLCSRRSLVLRGLLPGTPHAFIRSTKSSKAVSVSWYPSGFASIPWETRVDLSEGTIFNVDIDAKALHIQAPRPIPLGVVARRILCSGPHQ